ncbi:YitT family protein [Paraburkholderia sp. J12]|uniref:YitT family protein n=1 Tax=Paraburkholderia sp. J12 TaxID=2805432 RepID=UPI002ABD60DD|nr:YitT family protein [Paraburkholderia sp. J12]
MFRYDFPKTLRDPATQLRHRLSEDILALTVGTLLVSLGASMYSRAGLLTGGTAGLAFLAHYACGISFGGAYFLINLPFCLFAIRHMPIQFRVRTVCAVVLVSAFSGLHSRFIHYDHLNLFYAAVLGGVLMGTGFVVLFRHRASLGGVNAVALFLQERHNVRAGKVQMAVDVAVVLASMFVVSPLLLCASVLGAITLNLVVALNHKPGRYVGM